jgi:sugar phosphate isomerase/epimerase
VRLSCLPVSFFPEILSGQMSVAEWARTGARLNLDAVDLSILFIPDRSLASASRLRSQIESEGTRVAMVTTYPDFTHPDEKIRRHELKMEVEAVAIASELGAEMVRVTAGQAHPQTAIPDGIRWAADGLASLVDQCAQFGVTLVYENHAKPMVWEFTDFSQPPEIFPEICRLTSGSALMVNFDAGNAASFAADPVDLLSQVMDRVYSIHASDTARKGALEHVLLGTGVTPYQDIFKRLVESGWDSWICMEEASRQGVQGIEKAANYIRETWREACSTSLVK